MSLAVVILAAGAGTRLKSKLAKVLHPLAGQPMIQYVVENAEATTSSKPVVVVGYQGDQVRACLGDRAEYVEQQVQKGTGDAVRQARGLLEGRADTVLVTYGDMPLLPAPALHDLYEKHVASGGCLTMLTAISDEARGFGRIVRDSKDKVLRIVEESEATPQELEIRELNLGVYCFQASWLWEKLDQLKPNPRRGEYFLTDLVEMAVEGGLEVGTIGLVDPTLVMGINTRVHLAEAERTLRDRIRVRVMLEGVTLIDPASTFIDYGVEIGQDTVIYPGTHLEGETRIGTDCRIGPFAQLRGARVGNRCEISSSLIEQSTLEEEVKVGPYCHLRAGTHLERGVHLGDHAELKNAHLGAGTKMGHFSYVGDAEVGERVNIGAGTITCNYDGVRKHQTIIEEEALIGSDTMLVAPVHLGPRSRTGAGAVVLVDLPADSLAVGVPARVIHGSK